jgi:membrane fusion protein, multidrug efflux system
MGSEAAAGEKPAGNGGRKPILYVVLLAALIAGGLFGHRAYQFNTTHVTTDDAQLTSDIVPVAPQVSAAVIKVAVAENQMVHQGDVLVTLDRATYQAAYDIAKANLQAAEAAAQQAGVAISYASDTGKAQIDKAAGILAQAETGVDQAKAENLRSRGAIESAIAMEQGAKANAQLAHSALAAAESNLQRSKDSLSAAQAQLESAHAGLKAAQAAQDAAQAVAERASRDSARYAELLSEGATSAQIADNAAALARQTKAQLEAAKQQTAQARAAIVQQEANINAAKRQIEANTAAVAETNSQIKAAEASVAGAHAALAQAKAQAQFAAHGVDQAVTRKKQAEGDVEQAQTSPEHVEETKSARAQAIAKIAQAKAALESAQIQLNDTVIVAPVSGRVSKKTVEPGQIVQPGSPLMTIVPDNDLWVTANYKETQLAGVHTGSLAEVEVDGLPGKQFKGHVESISAGTGATFTLLPPDNATGNFTKVVQRIPVKIVLDPNQPDFDKLRAGMSVTSVIEIKHE